MSFNDDVTLDTSQVRSGGRGGGRGGLVVGGGVGGLLVAVLLVVLGVDPSILGTGGAYDPGQVEAAGGTDEDAFERCRTGADADADVECRVIGTVNSVQAFWEDELPRALDREWQPTQTVLYAGSTPSACGTASNSVGPFYCPSDRLVYVDADFFAVLTDRFGADDGALAQEYVVAHEYGHALQDQLGLLGRAQEDRQGADSGAVRVELMADCLAGVWAHHASDVTDEDTGVAFLEPLTREDVDSALSAAAAVGDDRIQEAATGRVDPESWTHGSAASRQRWFLDGYETGDLGRCDTFAVDSVSG